MVTEIQKQIASSLRNNDASSLRSLLVANPQEINGRIAGLSWLDRAASTDGGNLQMIKLLTELGAEIEPANVSRSPLAFAMQSSKLEVIEFLLENGGDPNHGRCIIGALNRQEEKLAAVKLLIEHGADVNRIFDLEGTNEKFTALDWTKDAEIVDYLRSVGAKTSAEVLGASSDEQADVDELAEVIQFFGNTFGEVDEKSLIEVVPSGHPVSIHVIRPSGNRKHLTLFTTGLSSVKMNVPGGLEEYSLAELFIQLPGDWEYASSDRRWSWPVEWLRRIAKHPHDNNVCLGGPVTIIANNDPPEPLGPNTDFTSLMLVAEKSFERSDGDIVQLYRVAPIYSDERELEIKEGAPALMRAFDRNSVPFIVDLQRPSVASGV